MALLEETYSGRFFRPRHKFAWRAPHICKAIVDTINPTSVIDVGCAIGDIVKGFLDLGIEAYGIEGSKECIPYMQVSEEHYAVEDLRKPIHINKRFDLVTCFEVAEHVEEEFSDILVDNLCNFSDKILMTFAEPGNQGHSHVNCQFLGYWWDKFVVKRNYKLSLGIPFKIRDILKPFREKDGIKAFFNHNFVYWEK